MNTPLTCQEYKELLTEKDPQDASYADTLRIAMHYMKCAGCREWLKVVSSVAEKHLSPEELEKKKAEASAEAQDFLRQYFGRN